MRAALAAELLRSAQARFVHRLHALLQVSLGQSCYDVARRFGEDPRSVERWLHRFARSGAPGLRDSHRPGRPARLSRAQINQLQRELAGPPLVCNYHQPRWTGKLVARHLEQNYQVMMGLRCCQRLLRGARCAARSPAAAADDAARA